MDITAFIDGAWAEHGEAPEAVAARLPPVAAQLQAPAQATAYAALVAHVLGEHLGRWPEALALVEAAGPAAAGDAEARAALARQAAALRWAAGDAAALAGLPPDHRVAALAQAASILAGRGELARAIAAYDDAEAAAQDLPEGSPAPRALAVGGNNLAASLQEQATRSTGETSAMLRAAAGGLRWWRLAGTWLQEERAWWRLSRCRLLAGDAAGAAEAARAGLAVCAAHGAPPFERFFLHAAEALALAAAGDAAGQAAARTAALAAHAGVADDERAWSATDRELLR
jgi:hypothetical protein